MPKTQFHNKLDAKIDEAVQKTSLSIATTPCQDYASYREQVGYIRGLIDASRLAEDVQKESE